jgi:uncharacterized protein involved in outer membrane biogenesis
MRRILIGVCALVGLAIILGIAAFIAIRSIDWNEYKGLVADAAREATGRRLDLSGDLSLAIGLRPGIAFNDVSFENADWGSRPDMARIERLIVQLRLIPLFSGHVEVDRIELVGLDLLLETNADGIVNWDFEELAEDAAEPMPDGEDGSTADEPLTALIRRLLIEDSLIVIRDHRADSGQSIAIERLSAETKDATSPVIFSIEAKLEEEPITLRGELISIADLLAGRALGLEFTLEAGGASSSVGGRIVPGPETTAIDFEIGIVGDELADWSGLAGSAVPGLGEYRIDLAISGGGTAFEVRSLKVEIGSTSVSGDLDLDLSGERPRLNARLKSPFIDLADLQDERVKTSPTPTPTPATAGAGSPVAQVDRDARLLPDDPLALEGLTAVDATVSLVVDTLRAGALELSDIVVDLALESGRLRVDPLALGIAGGRAKIAVELNASQQRPSLSLRGTGRDIILGDLSKNQGNDLLEGGPLDLKFDLRGRGGSIADIAGSLDGTLVLEIGNAQVVNQWAALALGGVQSILAGGANVTSAEINCVLADFAFKNGIARPKALVIDLSSIALFGAGKLDFGRERIKLKFDREAKETSASQVLPPFKIGGTFANPEPMIDAAEFAGRVVDFGADLLAGETQTTGGVWPKECRAMHELYEKAETQPEQPIESVKKAGKDAIKSLKGLFKR